MPVFVQKTRQMPDEKARQTGFEELAGARGGQRVAVEGGRGDAEPGNAGGRNRHHLHLLSVHPVPVGWKSGVPGEVEEVGHDDQGGGS